MTEIAILLLLIVLNGIFVMSEMAIVSARKPRLQKDAEKGKKNAEIALRLANRPSQFLPTVQVGITLVTILSGAFGETTLAAQLKPLLERVPQLAAYKETMASVIAIFTVTYLTIIIGELVPKQLGLNAPESISKLVAIPLYQLSRLSRPINLILTFSTDLVVKLLNIRPSQEPEVTEEEVKVLLQRGTEVGTFEVVEENMVKGVLELSDMRARLVMTPRPEVVWLDLEDPVDVNREKIVSSKYSRFPICDGDLDRVVGVIHVGDLLIQSLEGKSIDFDAVKSEPLFLPENTDALNILSTFQAEGNYLGIVVDEYGITQGIVTLNDIVSEVVGELRDEEQPPDPQVVQRDDGSWLVDGIIPFDEFLDKVPLNLSDREREEEIRDDFHTLAGFMVVNFGKIPTAADKFEWRNYVFEVMDMDGNRVDKVLVQKIEIEASEDLG